MRSLMIGRGGSVKYPLLTSLISYWSLDEASDGSAPVTRADSHGANHLTDNNTTASAAGKVGNGADFELANTESLSIADNAALSMGDIDFSIAVWVKFESAPLDAQGMTIVSKWDVFTNHREYALRWRKNTATSLDHLEFVVSNDGTAVMSVPAATLGTPTAGVWYFVVAWHDAASNTINIAVNNGATNSAAHTTGVLDSDSAFYLGSLNGVPAYYMDGIEDEVAIWKRTLSAAERAWLFNSGNGRSYAEIVAINAFQIYTDNLLSRWRGKSKWLIPALDRILLPNIPAWQRGRNGLLLPQGA